MEEQVGSEFGTTCTCLPDQVSRTAMLTCSDNNCAYCNAAETVCSGYAYGVVFNTRGVDVEYFEEDDYTKGRNDAIRYSETEDGCSVHVGTQKCSQCLMQECDDGYFGIDVSCSNVERGASYNSCEGTQNVGIFQAYNENEFSDCIRSVDICERDLASEPSKFECFCQDNQLDQNDSTMRCSDNCEYCNDDLSVCGQEENSRSFSNARFSNSTRRISYTSGRAEEIRLEQNECDATGCRKCKIHVDGVQCDQCSMKVCIDGSRAPQVTCENVEPGMGSIDFCLDRKLTGSVFEYMGFGFTDKCMSKSELACREAKVQYENHIHKFDCECAVQDEGDLELRCEATCGDLCNEEESICVREAFYQDFLDEGASSYFRKDIQYTVGRKELLSYIEFTDGICSMTIDGIGCKSCVVRTCPNNPEVERAPFIDCTDFEGGATLDLCEPNLKIETGIFERFSVEEFQECLDMTPSNGVCAMSQNVVELPFQTNGTTLLIPYDNTISCGRESFAPGLWYTVVGSGRGIEASLCETESDFRSQISIFSGSCDSLHCFDSSSDSCKASWYGDIGTKYHIKVHGVGGQTGNFGLAVKEIDFAEQGCQDFKENIEGNPDLATQCSACNATIDGSKATLECTAGCAICNANGDLCANKTDAYAFDINGRVTSSRTQYDFILGSTDSLIVSKSDCIGLDDCNDCDIRTDVLDDITCEPILCPDENRQSQGVLAVWDKNFTVDSCNQNSTEEADIFQVLTDETFSSCFSRDPSVACLSMLEYEEGEGSSVLCDCSGLEGGAERLVCQRTGCLQCNKERSSCGYSAFGYDFGSDFGRVVRQFEGFQFVEGRTNLVAYHEFNDKSKESDICMVTVGDATCATCKPVSCSVDQGHTHFHGKAFDCQEAGDLFYNGCSLVDLPGSFSFVNDPNYQGCVAVEDPQDACEQLKQKYLSNDSRLWQSCECSSVGNGGYELICTDADDCSLCTDKSGSLCADFVEHRAKINRFGSFLYHYDTFSYIAGSNDTLVIKDNGFECEVSINGEICSSCAFADCEDSETPYFIDCSNVLGELATYQCGTGHEVFAVVAEGTIHSCESDTESPTASPIGAQPDASSLASGGPLFGVSRFSGSILLVSVAISLVFVGRT